MKVIEALKKTKLLRGQIDALQGQISLHCAKKNFETSPFPDPKAKVRSLLQAAHDLNLELESLNHRIHKTNVNSRLKIDIGGQPIEKSIDEWIYRRRLGAAVDQATWSKLTDRGIKEEQIKQTDGSFMIVTIDRHFDVAERDQKLAAYRSEPFLIDTALEIWNAVIDLHD